MHLILFFALFCFGLAAGSFLNVLSLRYDPTKSIFASHVIGGRSYCPRCGKTLRAHELIPLLSFFLQRGKCKRCRAPISWQYPIVEFLSGIIFVTIPLALNHMFGFSNNMFGLLDAPQWYYGLIVLWMCVLLILVLVTLIDMRLYIIPDELNGALSVLAVFLAAVLFFHQSKIPLFADSFISHYRLIFSPFQNIIANRLLGAFGGFLFFAFFVFMTRGRGMGMGDAKLAFALGLLFGWPDIGLIIALAFIVGGIVGGVMLLRKKKHMKDKLPFAPFLILGTFLVFFFGYQILQAYFSFFNL